MPGWQKPPQPASPRPAPTRKTSTDRGRAQRIPHRHTGRPGAAWLHECARTAGVRPRNPHPHGGIPPARAARRRHLTCTPRVTSIDKTSARTSDGYLLATPQAAVK